MGEGEFVEQVLAQAQEKFSRQYELKRRGYDLEKIEQRACELYKIDRKEFYVRGRQKQRVEARRLAIYWAVRELGLTGISLARRYHLTPPKLSSLISRLFSFQ